MIDTLASQLEKRGSSPVQSPSAPHQSPSASNAFDEQYRVARKTPGHYTLHIASPAGTGPPPAPMHFRIKVPDSAPASPMGVHVHMAPSQADEHVFHMRMPSRARPSKGLTLHVRMHGGAQQPAPMTVPISAVSSHSRVQPFTVNIVQATHVPSGLPTAAPTFATAPPSSTPSATPTHAGLPRFPPVEVFTRTPINRQDCEVGTWSKWTECSATCGRGLKMQHRTVTKPAVNGGQPCPSLQHSDYCNTDPCPCVRQTTGGEFCIFPFFWNGRNQWDCVEYDATLRMWWCPTVKEFKDPFPGHQMVENDYPEKRSFPGLPHKEWDWCEAGCAQLNKTEVARLTKQGITMTNFAP